MDPEETTQEDIVFPENVSIKTHHILRKVLENEAILYDRPCPKCGSAKLIFRWDIKERAYVGHGRCSASNCKYGN